MILLGKGYTLSVLGYALGSKDFQKIRIFFPLFRKSLHFIREANNCYPLNQ